MPVTAQDLVRYPGVFGMATSQLTGYLTKDSVRTMLNFVKDHNLTSYLLGSTGTAVVANMQRLPIAGSAFISGRESTSLYDASMMQHTIYGLNQKPM